MLESTKSSRDACASSTVPPAPRASSDNLMGACVSFPPVYFAKLHPHFNAAWLSLEGQTGC